jgi:hypothetical protein
LIDSGFADASTAAEASSRFAAWQSTLDAETAKNARFGPMNCFRAGCLATAEFHGVDAYQRASRSLGITHPFQPWSSRSAIMGPFKTTEDSWVGIVVVSSPDRDVPTKR